MHFHLTEYGGDRGVTAAVERHDNGLQLNFDLSPIADIQWPSGVDQGERRDHLWQHTCLELFMANPNSTDYVEFNVSPAGDWNCYSFDGYRTGMQTSDALTLRNLDARLDDRWFSITASLDIPWEEVLLAPSAVTENRQGQLSYFAVSHGDKPDFHDRSRYVHATLNHL